MHTLALAAILVLGLLIAPLAAEAQQRLQLYGFVQWISGTKLIMMADPGWSVAVDLTGADQRSYGELRSSDWVTVIGEVARDRSRVIACQVLPDPGPPGPACDNAELWTGSRQQRTGQNLGQPQTWRTPLRNRAGADEGHCGAASRLVARRGSIQGQQSHQDLSRMGPISATKPGLSPSRYIGKILSGAKGDDHPIDQLSNLELIINLKAAKALGLAIPQSLLLRADQVIE